jgi:glycerol transport system ATP-binding protein
MRFGATMQTAATLAPHSLSLQGITRVVRGETHLHPLDLCFEPQSFNVVLGRTRAGKTSLLRVLAGLDRASTGRLSWGQSDVTHVHVRQRDVAMVYQQFINYPSLSVFENIASPLRLRKHASRAEIERRVRETAELLGLSSLLTRLPAELSGGQQQRTAIARALVKDAGLILLDEPLANLDYKLREELRTQLRSLFQSTGTIAVYATADPDEALLLGGRTFVLDEGRLLQQGQALDVYEHPQSQRVAQVFSDPELNLLDLTVASPDVGKLADLTAIPLTHAPLRGLSQGNYRLGIRAHHLQLTRNSDADLALQGTTLVDEVTGSMTLLHVAFGATVLVAQLPGIHRQALGAHVQLFVSPDRLLLFDWDGRALSASPPRSVRN